MSLPKIFLSIALLIFACKENMAEPAQSVDLFIGETPIKVNCYKTGQSTKIVYFNMHDDENTAVDAIRTFLETHDGYFVELKAQGDRFVGFRLNQAEYKFDPNRIFTEAGIEKSKAPVRALRQFVDTLFTFLFVKDVRTVVALHNNSEGSFSAQSYTAGEPLEKNVAEYNINPNLDADDFYYVTEQWMFTALKSRNENVVLQNTDTVQDDGSLSVYCGQNSISYINIEAQHDHVEEQIRMITLLHNILLENKNGQ